MNTFRKGLRALTMSAALSLAALPAATSAFAVDWQQAKGTELFLGMNKHAYTDAITPLIPEFEKLTGIKVTMESYAQDEFMNKRLVDLSSGAGTFDIVMMDQAIVQYAGANWIEPLDSYFSDPKVVDAAAYDMADFLPSMIKDGKVDGKLYGIPISGEAQILFYRKDIFEKEGIKVPTTMDELLATAKKLNKPGEMAGILLRGQKIHTAWNSSGFVWSYGGRIFDDPTKPTKAMFDSKEAAEAITMYATLLQEAGPPGVGNYTWYECVSDFQQGKAAMYLDASVFMSQLEDPSKSTVAGKIGYAGMPAGPKGTFANTGSWMLSMSSSSKNKVGAALFLAWATGKETALKVGESAGLGVRASVFESPAVQAKYPAEWAKATAKSMQSVNPEPGFPLITQIDEWLDIYGGAVNATILKQGDAQSNLSAAAKKMDDVLARGK
jgi:multiple sugar transport system substrate-binding protein